MKYMLLVYHAETAWVGKDKEDAVAESVALCHELNRKGQYVSASPLQPVSTAASVRIRNNAQVVTDGPFAETTEHLGGYFLVDVETQEEAIAIAKRIPGGRRGIVEVRPIVELSTLPRQGV